MAKEKANKTKVTRDIKEKLRNQTYSAVAKKEKAAKELLNASKQQINSLEKDAINHTNHHMTMNRKVDDKIDKTEQDWKTNQTKKEAEFKKVTAKRMDDARKKLEEEK